MFLNQTYKKEKLCQARIGFCSLGFLNLLKCNIFFKKTHLFRTNVTTKPGIIYKQQLKQIFLKF